MSAVLGRFRFRDAPTVASPRARRGGTRPSCPRRRTSRRRRAGACSSSTTAAIGLALVGVMAMRMTPGRTRPARRLGDGVDVGGAPDASAPTRSATSPGRRATAAGGSPTSSGGRCRRWFASTDRSQVSASTIVRPVGARRRRRRRRLRRRHADRRRRTRGDHRSSRRGPLRRRSRRCSRRVRSSPPSSRHRRRRRRRRAARGRRRRDDRAARRDHRRRLDGRRLRRRVRRSARTATTCSRWPCPKRRPIFDADGDLVGLCTIGPDGVEMLRGDIAPRRRRRRRRPSRPNRRDDRGHDRAGRTAAADRPARPSRPKRRVDGDRVDGRRASSLPESTDSSAVATSESPATSTPPDLGRRRPT